MRFQGAEESYASRTDPPPHDSTPDRVGLGRNKRFRLGSDPASRTKQLVKRRVFRAQRTEVSFAAASLRNLRLVFRTFWNILHSCETRQSSGDRERFAKLARTQLTWVYSVLVAQRMRRSERTSSIEWVDSCNVRQRTGGRWVAYKARQGLIRRATSFHKTKCVIKQNVSSQREMCHHKGKCLITMRNVPSQSEMCHHKVKCVITKWNVSWKREMCHHKSQNKVCHHKTNCAITKWNVSPQK